MRMSPLHRTRPTRKREPEEAEWKQRRYGSCKVCKRRGPLVLHHLVKEQDIRKATSKEEQAAGIVWDARNALEVGAPGFMGGRCQCHDNHGSHANKIPFSLVSAEAQKYAIEVLGKGPAEIYWRRHYEAAP